MRARFRVLCTPRATKPGNSDDTTVVETLAPFVVVARYVKIHAVDFFLWPSFRAALLVADHTTCPDGSMCVNGSVVACPANQRCINGTVLSCPENSFCANGTISGCPSNHTCKDGSVLCRAQVGATVRWNGTGCEYHVRSVNFMVRIASSVIHETTSDAKFVTVNRRYPPISCPVRDSWNMEIPSNIKPLQSAIQIDGGPWMAWSWRNNLLPSPVKTRVRLRVYYAGRIMEFVGRPRFDSALPRAIKLTRCNYQTELSVLFGGACVRARFRVHSNFV